MRPVVCIPKIQLKPRIHTICHLVKLFNELAVSNAREAAICPGKPLKSRPSGSWEGFDDGGQGMLTRALLGNHSDDKPLNSVSAT